MYWYICMYWYIYIYMYKYIYIYCLAVTLHAMHIHPVRFTN